VILFKFTQEDLANCRVYYRNAKTPQLLAAANGTATHLYCIQNDGSHGKDRFVFYSCSKDGEPSHQLRMPLDESFDKKVMPRSNERPVYYECGICGSFHPWNWDGDCRDDANRFSIEQLNKKHGVTSWVSRAK
jgi:hypothetical protein